MEESVATRKPHQVELLVALEHFIHDVSIVEVVVVVVFFFFFLHVCGAVGSQHSVLLRTSSCVGQIWPPRKGGGKSSGEFF
jgi:hypothetical protein